MTGETIKEKEIDKVTEKIFDILIDAKLSYIEKFGILECIRHELHDEIEYVVKEEVKDKKKKE